MSIFLRNNLVLIITCLFNHNLWSMQGSPDDESAIKIINNEISDWVYDHEPKNGRRHKTMITDGFLNRISPTQFARIIPIIQSHYFDEGIT